MPRNAAFFGFCLIICLCGGACSSGGSNGNTTDPVPPDTAIADPSFATDIQAVFSNSCALANCHNASAQGGLVLLGGQAYGQIVNVDSFSEPAFKRVLPGNAATSYIIIKLEGRQSIGAQMPLSGTISATKLQNIKNWINLGAKNN